MFGICIPFGKKGAYKSLYIRSIQTHIILQSITYLFLQILFLILRISECGWSLPSTPYHQPGALPLPKVLEVLDIILSVHIPIAPNSHTGSPWIWMMYATGVSTITLISIQQCDPVVLGKRPILNYSILTRAMKQNILHIMILAKYIQNITDSSTVNYEMMPSSEEIIFKTAVESAGYFKGLIDERKDLTFVKITGLLKLFFKRISIKRAAFFTKSCTFEQAL